MKLKLKLEDIFKPAEPQEVDVRKQAGKAEYQKQLNAKSTEEMIEELIEADMEQISMDPESVKLILMKGFKGYKTYSRQELMDEYEAFFGGWEEFHP